MQGKTHVTVGVVTLGCLCVAFPKGIQIQGQVVLPQIAMLTAAIGSYLPDIDIQQSALGQKYSIISKHLKHRGFTHTLVIPMILSLMLIMCVAVPARYVLYFNIFIDLIGVAFIGKMVYKMGIKHGSADLDDIVQAVCFGWILILTLGDMYTTKAFASIVFGLIFGWIMHIVADLCNKKGVPLFPGMPHLHIMTVLTGSWQEAVWLAVYVASVIAITVKGVFI